MYANSDGSIQRRPSTLTAVCLVGTLLMTGTVPLADAVLPTDAALPSGMPVPGHISSKFGLRKSPFSGQIEFHRGVDISARRGTKVVATADGKVTQAGWQGVCGRAVTLRHPSGFDTRYCHLERVRVLVGEQVRRGDVIGTVGSTGRSAGPHLHYSVSRNGKSLDPDPFLKTGRDRGPRVSSPLEAQGRGIRDVKSRIEGLRIQSSRDRKRIEARVESQERDIRDIKGNQKQIIEGLNRLETRMGQIEAALNSRREFNEPRAPETVPLRGAAQAVEAEVQRRLGLAYYYGEYGVRRDYRQAARCFRQAAEQGDATAELYMGLLHLDGEGVQQDYQQAVRWFRRATHKGNARGQYYLALCYYYGKGMRRDYEEAIRWFRRAAQQGHAPSQGFLGI